MELFLFMKLLALFVVCFLCLVSCTPAKPYSGVDVQDHVYISGFQCLKEKGYDYAIVRVCGLCSVRWYADYFFSVGTVMVHQMRTLLVRFAGFVSFF